MTVTAQDDAPTLTLNTIETSEGDTYVLGTGDINFEDEETA